MVTGKTESHELGAEPPRLNTFVKSYAYNQAKYLNGVKMDETSWDNGRDIFKSIRFSCSQWFQLVARNFSQQSDIIYEGYGGHLAIPG